jgi:hypothetical protein
MSGTSPVTSGRGRWRISSTRSESVFLILPVNLTKKCYCGNMGSVHHIHARFDSMVFIYSAFAMGCIATSLTIIKLQRIVCSRNFVGFGLNFSPASL